VRGTAAVHRSPSERSGGRMYRGTSAYRRRQGGRMRRARGRASSCRTPGDRKKRCYAPAAAISMRAFALSCPFTSRRSSAAAAGCAPIAHQLRTVFSFKCCSNSRETSSVYGDAVRKKRLRAFPGGTKLFDAGASRRAPAEEPAYLRQRPSSASSPTKALSFVSAARFSAAMRYASASARS